MEESRTAGPDPTGRTFAREFFTPLNAMSAWAVIVAGGTVWPALDPLSEKLAFAGAVVSLTLALHVLHEAGHVVAGALVGLPFSTLTVGLFTVRREPHGAGWRLAWDVNGSWRKFAGCVEREITPGPGIREAMTITALGGPVASLIAGFLLIGAPPPWRGLGVVSLLVGLFNVLPTALLGQPSDGMIVYRLWSQRADAVAWRAPLCEAADETADEPHDEARSDAAPDAADAPAVDAPAA